jgi:hypothetical protein
VAVFSAKPLLFFAAAILLFYQALLISYRVPGAFWFRQSSCFGGWFSALSPAVWIANRKLNSF